jgi:hypothetical protein
MEDQRSAQSEETSRVQLAFTAKLRKKEGKKRHSEMI